MDPLAAEKRLTNLKYLRNHTSYIWVLDSKDPITDEVKRFTMPVNPDSASDISKIS